MLITITDPYISLLIVGQAVRICVLLSPLFCSRVGKHPLQGHDGEQVGGRVCVSGSVQAGGLMLLDSSVLTELKGRHGWPVGYPKEASQMSVPETGWSTTHLGWSFSFPVMAFTRFFQQPIHSVLHVSGRPCLFLSVIL